MGNIGPRAQRRTQPSAARVAEAEAVRVERIARERRDIEQVRASAAAGCTVDLEAVEAWVESWDTANELPMPRSGR